MFLLLGATSRLPRELREGPSAVPGGATVPLTLESWRLMDGRLRGWISPGAKRCIAALREGRPAPPAVLEVSALHEDPTFVLAPGHDAAQLEAFAALAAPRPASPATAGGDTRWGRRASTRGCRRSAPIRSASPSSTSSSPRTKPGSHPRRSRCCRRSARSTPAPRAWSRCRPRPRRRSMTRSHPPSAAS